MEDTRGRFGDADVGLSTGRTPGFVDEPAGSVAGDSGDASDGVSVAHSGAGAGGSDKTAFEAVLQQRKKNVRSNFTCSWIGIINEAVHL